MSDRYQLTVIDAEQVPLDLLLEADPSMLNIERYLPKSTCFAIVDGELIVGVCVVLKLENDVFEIMNIATAPNRQAQGLGARLLNFALQQLKLINANSVELTTGTFGHQLGFYQRHGFRVAQVLRDHFLKHYDEPIIENGIQHKDALRLVCDLN